MGVGEVIDAGLKLARQKFRHLATIAAYAVIPAFVFGAILDLLTRGSQSTNLATYCGPTFGSTAVPLATAHLISWVEADGKLDLASNFRLAGKRIGGFISLTFIAAQLAVLLIVVFPLGTFCIVRWSTAPNALIIEGTGPIQCLRRSWALT